MEGRIITLPCIEIPENEEINTQSIYNAFVKIISFYPKFIQHIHERIPIDILITYKVKNWSGNPNFTKRLFVYVNTPTNKTRRLWGNYN